MAANGATFQHILRQAAKFHQKASAKWGRSHKQWGLRGSRSAKDLQFDLIQLGSFDLMLAGFEQHTHTVFDAV